MINKMHMVRIWLTEDCNALCQFCMNSKNRGTAQMSLDKFELICSYFKENGFDIIAVMGGEPTIHPHFSEMMSVAQNNFNRVYLYTNALKVESLQSFTPREQDLVVYNSAFARNITRERLLLDKPGERILEVIVNYDSDIVSIIENIHNVTSLSEDRIKVQLVLNNSENIFKHKDEIIKNINSIFGRLVEMNINTSFECAAPLCFTFGENLPPHRNNTICPQEAILIDGSYNARFCNIYPDSIINLFTSSTQDTLIPFQLLRNHVQRESFRIKLACLDKVCKDCLYYGFVCNGKCHIGQEIVKREDIVKNTLIPWLNNGENY